MKTKTSPARRTSRTKLKRKVVGSGAGFGAALRGHPLPTRKQWDKVTTALGPCGDQSPETIVWVLNSYRRICGRLQECVQKHNLGMAGYYVDEIAVTHIDDTMRLLNELAQCYFARRSEGLLELMMRVNRLTSPNIASQTAAPKTSDPQP